MDLTEEDKLAYAAELYDDPVRFCREVLSDWFPSKMPWLHRGILALLLRQCDFLLNIGEEEWANGTYSWTVEDLRKLEEYFVYDPVEKRYVKDSPTQVKLFHITWDGDTPLEVTMVVSDKIMEMIPRGFSKTTLMNAAVIFMILYKTRKFIVYLSETATHSKSQLKNVKTQLETNTLIHAIFGDVTSERGDPQKWTDEEIETQTGIFVVCRGRGGQVRGLNRDGNRPDLIILDDVEDKESVATPEQRRKTLEWIKGDVEPARSEMSETFIFALGTMLHREAMLPSLMNDPEWISIRFGAIDPAGDPLWAELMSLEKIERRKKSYIATGTLSIFYMELMSELVASETAKFKQSHLQHLPLGVYDTIARSIVIDPALSEGVKASACAFAVVGITEKGRIHVYESCGRKGMNPSEQIDKFFELAVKYDCTHHGVEAIAYQRALVHLMQEQMFIKGKEYGAKAYFEIHEIRHGRIDKAERVLGVLQKRYHAGYITHQRVFPELEGELLDWNADDPKDYSDAVAMAIGLLDPFASLNADEDDGLEDDTEESLDMAVGGDFRTAP